MKICVVGYGFVGKAMVAAFDQSDEIDYDIVDPAFSTYDQKVEDVMESCEAAVICVPTPEGRNGQCDDSLVVETVQRIGKHKLILIKSTTDISTLKWFKDNYPNVCFSPEFLRGRSSVDDFLRENKMIIGGLYANSLWWSEVFRKCIAIEDEAFIDIVEAGYVKYSENSFLAMRVTFFNDLYNLVKDANPEIDFENITCALALDERVGPWHNQVPGYDGKFGWGGHCLPKDTAAFVDYAKRTNGDLPLIRAVRDINDGHRNVKKVR
jgi:UDPglucose 6-dehydrogenase